MGRIRTSLSHLQNAGRPTPDTEAHRSDPAPVPPDAAPGGRAPLLEPTTKMTGHQFFYIFGLDGIGAVILSGGINFAIAYAMYSTQNTRIHPIRLFQLPNTLAGDAAVTIIIQTFITWIVEYILVNRDLHNGTVAPAAFIRRPQSRFGRWWFLLQPKTITATRIATNSSSSNGDAAAPADDAATTTAVAAAAATTIPVVPPAAAAAGEGCDEHYLFAQALRALIVSVAAFAVLWGPTVGILAAVGTRCGGDWVFRKTWVPQLFKLVFGGVLALLTTPAFAVFWLARAGWMMAAEPGANGEASPEQV